MKVKASCVLYAERGLEDGVLGRTLGLRPNAGKSGAKNMQARKAYDEGYKLGYRGNVYLEGYRNAENLLFIAVQVGDVENVGWRFSFSQYDYSWYVETD